MCLNVARGLWLVINESLDLLLLTMLFETSAISTEFCTFAYRFCLLRVCPQVLALATWAGGVRFATRDRTATSAAFRDLCLIWVSASHVVSRGYPYGYPTTFNVTFTFICALSARRTSHNHRSRRHTVGQAQTHNLMSTPSTADAVATLIAPACTSPPYRLARPSWTKCLGAHHMWLGQALLKRRPLRCGPCAWPRSACA